MDKLPVLENFGRMYLNEKLEGAYSLIKREHQEVLVFNMDEEYVGMITEKVLLENLENLKDLTARDVLARIPPVKVNTPEHVVARQFLYHNVKSLPVVDENNNFMGVIRDLDLVGEFDFEDRKVSEFMTSGLITIESNRTLQEAISLMKLHNISRLIVKDVDSDKLVGILTTYDVVNHVFEKVLREEGKNPILTSVDLVMTHDIETIKVTDTLNNAAKIMKEKGISSLVTIDKEDKMVGIITIKDLLDVITIPATTEGYFIRILGDLDDTLSEKEIYDEMIALLNKFKEYMGKSGQVFLRFKPIKKKKFRGNTYYEVRGKISTNKGYLFTSTGTGFGALSAYGMCIERLEREISMKKFMDQKSRQLGEVVPSLEDLLE